MQPKAPGLGESQRGILAALKREGGRSIPELSRELGLNVETLRAHVQALEAHGLVQREARRQRGRGRPEIVYGLAAEAESLFPRREGEVLRALAVHLRERGQEAVLERFFAAYIGERQESALAQLTGLEGRSRLEAAARVLSELGFMAEVTEVEGVARLRLCHCPVRELVEVTRVPCRIEIGFVQALLGDELTRVSYIPAGESSCSYRVGGC